MVSNFDDIQRYCRKNPECHLDNSIFLAMCKDIYTWQSTTVDPYFIKKYKETSENFKRETRSASTSEDIKSLTWILLRCRQYLKEERLSNKIDFLEAIIKRIEAAIMGVEASHALYTSLTTNLSIVIEEIPSQEQECRAYSRLTRNPGSEWSKSAKKKIVDEALVEIKNDFGDISQEENEPIGCLLYLIINGYYIAPEYEPVVPNLQQALKKLIPRHENNEKWGVIFGHIEKAIEDDKYRSLLRLKIAHADKTIEGYMTLPKGEGIPKEKICLHMQEIEKELRQLAQLLVLSKTCTKNDKEEIEEKTKHHLRTFYKLLSMSYEWCLPDKNWALHLVRRIAEEAGTPTYFLHVIYTQPLAFIRANGAFFQYPTYSMSDKERVVGFYESINRTKILKKYSMDLEKLLYSHYTVTQNHDRKTGALLNQTKTPVIYAWRQGNFRPALKHPAIRQFLIKHQFHPAIVLWSNQKYLTREDIQSRITEIRRQLEINMGQQGEALSSNHSNKCGVAEEASSTEEFSADSEASHSEESARLACWISRLGGAWSVFTSWPCQVIGRFGNPHQEDTTQFNL